MGEMYKQVSDYTDTPFYRFARSRRYILIMISMLLVLMLAIPTIGGKLWAVPYSDNAYYLVVAKSLSQGTGLRVISHPDTPLATVAPPGYPFLLSGFVKIFGLDSPLPYRLLNTAFWIATIIIFGLLVKQEDGAFWAFLVLFLTALNVYIMEYAYEILTELSYTFFSIVAIILANKLVKQTVAHHWVWLILLVLSLSTLLYLRMIAIALVAAVGLFFVLYKQIYTGVLVVGIAVLSYLPWVMVWSRNVATPAQLFETNEPFNLDAEPKPFLEVVSERIVSNSLYYTAAARQNILGWSYFENLSTPLIYHLIGVGVITFILVGWWIKLKATKTALIPLYLAFYLFILIVPISKGVARYLIPITPFLVWYFLIGTATLVGMLGKLLSINLPRLRLVFFAVYVALFYSVLLSTLLVALVKIPVLLGKLSPEEAAVSSYLEAADWLKLHTPQEEVILARKMDALYLRSGRQAVRYPFTTDQELMIAFLSHYDISYVVLDSLGYPSTEEFLLPFLNNNREAFEEVFKTSDGLTSVYRFNPELVKQVSR